MPSPFVHLELTTPDLKRAKDFYGQLCGWTFNDAPMPPPINTYAVFNPGTGPGGGLVSMPGAPTGWLAYIGVDDIHSATKKAAALGAKVIRDVEEVPGHGWMSILIDPTGANIALWQNRGNQSS
jgi:predicted enzyme related to lactoylglutathione lyase